MRLKSRRLAGRSMYVMYITLADGPVHKL